MAKKKKSNQGSKGKYEVLVQKGLIQKVEGWARDGLIDEQIIENIGISKDTFYRWKKLHIEFSDALNKGKEFVDRQVENALLKRALGYEYEEVTQEIMEDATTGRQRMAETKRVRKQVAPDTTAQIFWLKNRKPGEWRDKKDIDANVNVNKKLEDFFGSDSQ